MVVYVSYVARGKRVVKLGDGNIADLGDMYLTDFLTPYSYGVSEVYGEAWNMFGRDYSKAPLAVKRLAQLVGVDTVVIKEIWNWVISNVDYRFDSKYFGVSDFWQLPNETFTMRHGDCEDTTFLLASAVIREVENAFEDVFKDEVKVYACLGYYIDSSGTYYGHGFPIMKNNLVNSHLWLWLESTLDTPIQLGVWYGVNFNTLLPVYFFNDKEVNRIDKDYAKLGLTKDYVDKHKEYIDAMIQYVESGVKMSVKWMHKGRRPPDLASGIKIDLNEMVG